jgi:hypothetical protein
MAEDKGKDPKEEKIKDAIKKEGDKVEPKDKNALAKIRQRTGADKRGNGGRGKK